MNVLNVVDEMMVQPVGTAEELTVNTAVVTAAAGPATATHAMIGVRTATVHVGFDRDPADGGAGIPLTAGSVRIWRKSAVAKARFIRGAGAAAVVSIEWVTLQG